MGDDIGCIETALLDHLHNLSGIALCWALAHLQCDKEDLFAKNISYLAYTYK